MTPTEVILRRMFEDLSGARLQLAILEDERLSPSARDAAERLCQHYLTDANQSLRRLARSQESALGKRLAS